MAKGNHISDKDYVRMSGSAYDDLPPGRYDGAAGSWNVIEPKDAKLHDSYSGFDAAVFRNKDTNQIVVAFRGTEPKGGLSRTVPDVLTDYHDIVKGRFKELEETYSSPVKTAVAYLNPFRNAGSEHIQYSTNQFRRADQLVEALKEKYPNAEISLTGHSLGGALAQYAAAKHQVEAVTYSAPSVMNLLPDDLAKQAKQGKFDDLITNYVNPKDAIGAGALSEYERHVGSTYYINDDYVTANQEYEGALGAARRLKDTPFGVNHHSMKHYKFDEDGNISNELVNRLTGERLNASPRLPLIDRLAPDALPALFAGAMAGQPLFASLQASGLLGGSGGGLLQLRPQELMQVARTLQGHVEQFHHEAGAALSTIAQLLHTSQSRRLAAITEAASQDLRSTKEWYAAATRDIAEYIGRKAEEFHQADTGLA
ncbi:lipase family protein [Paenibacillus dendritiformis]|uniref:lipase family protein n=1 Tax=Paenibacillus dendritiformis TaxID=130049 RepID=UPI00248BE298|nr:lipase family protein [Paenibacillus dendritiformis]WGU93538.1 lipase family protein [Paenibacillus dendritiformis]